VEVHTHTHTQSYIHTKLHTQRVSCYSRNSIDFGKLSQSQNSEVYIHSNSPYQHTHTHTHTHTHMHTRLYIPLCCDSITLGGAIIKSRQQRLRSADPRQCSPGQLTSP